MKTEDSRWCEWGPTILIAVILILISKKQGATMEEFLKILSGALTPLIAIVTVYIAIQQYGINKLKIKSDERSSRLKQRHDLYERRLSVFEAAMNIIAAAHGSLDERREELHKFHRAISESYFLFGQDMIDYLRQLELKYNRMQFLKGSLNRENLPIGDERSKLANEQHTLSLWFGDQFNEARKKFAEYLSLSELGQI